MKLNFILTLLTITILASCGKKTQVKGIVYSKHNIPVPNVSVSYERYRESSYPETSYFDIVKTDANGNYQFDFKGTKKYRYHVKCFCDSGYQNKSISLGNVNTIDLHLE